jgi:hypothetical protein
VDLFDDLKTWLDKYPMTNEAVVKLHFGEYGKLFWDSVRFRQSRQCFGNICLEEVEAYHVVDLPSQDPGVIIGG